MQGTVIYSEKNDSSKNSAILTNTEGKIIKHQPYDWTVDGDEGPAKLDEFELFDYFDKLFGCDNYDTIIILIDGIIHKTRKRVRAIKGLTIKQAIIGSSCSRGDFIIAVETIDGERVSDI